MLSKESIAFTEIVVIYDSTGLKLRRFIGYSEKRLLQTFAQVMTVKL